MRVVKDGIILPIRFLNLVETLRYHETLDPVSGHERQLRFKKTKTSKTGKLIEHHEQSVFIVLSSKFQLFGESPTKLVQDKAHERLGTVNITWRNNQVQGNRVLAVHQVMNTKI